MNFRPVSEGATGLDAPGTSKVRGLLRTSEEGSRFLCLSPFHPVFNEHDRF